MPGKVGVKIKAGRNLPVMDRSSDTTDAYVEIKLGNVTHKTDVCRKSLNPQWNTDWFRFEVDDAELQDEPLQIRLMDYDTYSANDAIGKVNISLNPLCLETSGPGTHGKGTVLSGWIPVFDTMHGIRGEVNVIVKVDLFSDLNKFRQSSCGVPFFHSPCIPFGYRAQFIHGFVEELVVNDDPEYQWIDKIRTPRASNEARQVVFLKLSGQVQRKMGLKAINMGANAVIGYTQCFDLEGDVGVVARGVGTAVTLIKDMTSNQPTATTAASTADNALIEERTKKYIEFLTGSHINLAENPPLNRRRPGPIYELQIHKSPSFTHFDLQHANLGAMEDNDIMCDLMRQEDQRGEKPAKKLRHHMKRFTHSSRNLLNEKYNAIVRKFGDSIDTKSSNSISRSLNSLCGISTAIILREDNTTTTSGSSARSSTGNAYDTQRRRRQSFKAKMKMFDGTIGGAGWSGGATKLQRKPNNAAGKRGSGSGSGAATVITASYPHHAILRSASADSTVTRSVAASKVGPAAVASISEYSDSTRSSPNICAQTSIEGHNNNDNEAEVVGEDLDTLLEMQRAILDKPLQFQYNNDNNNGKTTTPSLTSGSCDRSDSSSCVDVLAAIHGGHYPFSEQAAHDDHTQQLYATAHDAATIRSCSSSNTLSLSPSDSSIGSETELMLAARDEVEMERLKMHKYLKICKDTERIDAKWIQPSELDSLDDSLTDLTPRHTLMQDLKALSQHVQEFIHSKPKKVEKLASLSPPASPTASVTPQQQQRQQQKDYRGIAATPPQTLLLQPPNDDECKAFYSSQPEICQNWDGDLCTTPPPLTLLSLSSSVPNTIFHSRSLINLRHHETTAAVNAMPATVNNLQGIDFRSTQQIQAVTATTATPTTATTTRNNDLIINATNANACQGYVSDSDTSSAYLPVTVKTFASNNNDISNSNKNNNNINNNNKYPVFKICPSTPTPSETDLTKIPYIEDDASTVRDDDDNDNDNDDVDDVSVAETETGAESEAEHEADLEADADADIPTPVLGRSVMSVATDISPTAPSSVNSEFIAISPMTSRKYVVGKDNNNGCASISSPPQRFTSAPAPPTSCCPSVISHNLNANKLFTNHNNFINKNANLLAPPSTSLSLPSPSPSPLPLPHTPMPMPMPIPTSTSTNQFDQQHDDQQHDDQQHDDQQQQQLHHHHHHHHHDHHHHHQQPPTQTPRSVNEVNAATAVVASAAAAAVASASSSGITDSPSMKRFTSPAQAAVVAAGASSSSSSKSNASVIANTPTSAHKSNNINSSSGGKSAAGGDARKQSTTSSVVAAADVTGTTKTTTSLTPAAANTTTSTSSAAAKEMPTEMCRRSSDSDLSITPKGNSLCVASERLVAATAMMRLNQPLGNKGANTADGMEGLLEYPFLTLTKYPPGFILHIGATVAARSVKLLERVPNPDEPEVRDSWWTELRMEIRSHARALGCNVVLGYSEATTISDDVCVLSATGTAAVINMAYNRSISQTDILSTAVKQVGIGITVGVGSAGVLMSASLEERDMLRDLRNNGIVSEALLTSNKDAISSSVGAGGSGVGTTTSSSKRNAAQQQPHTAAANLNFLRNSACGVCHVPYSLASVPFNVKMKKCAVCHKGRVPDVLLATLEVPDHLHVTGRGCFMQAQVVRAKKDLRSELNAKEISDGLPFLEYELHRVLINKLKAKGMNAIFGLRAQVAIGERMIALIATGTALFLTALPMPQVPKIVAGNSWTDKQKLNELQKKLQETFERNQEVYQLKCIDPDVAAGVGGGGVVGAAVDKQSDTDDSDDEVIEVDLNCGNKDTCVLEVDDIDDLEIISLLMEAYPPEGFHVVNTQNVPGMLDIDAVKNLQMFTQIWRAKLDISQNISGFPKHFQRILQTIYFKLRTMIPCAICDLRFRLDLPESDQIQLLVTGMALSLGDANKFKYRRKAAAAIAPSQTPSTGGISSNGTAANDAHDANGQTTTTTTNNKRILQEEDYIFPLDEDQMVETPTPTSNLPPYGLNSFKMSSSSKASPSRQPSGKKPNMLNRNCYFPLRDRYGVDITPMSFVPGGRIDKYLGNLNFFFIRETTSIRETGGISGFVHSFITELLAVVRAHISALGGNAMVSFYMSELILVDNQHKNQGQCLISIGGDAVYVSYHSDD